MHYCPCDILLTGTHSLPSAHRGDLRLLGVDVADFRELRQQEHAKTRRRPAGSTALRPAVRPRRCCGGALLRQASIVRFVQGVLAPFNATIIPPSVSAIEVHRQKRRARGGLRVQTKFVLVSMHVNEGALREPAMRSLWTHTVLPRTHIHCHSCDRARGPRVRWRRSTARRRRTSTA